MNIIKEKNLVLDNEKYRISKRLYLELIAQTNFIKSFKECRAYVYRAINKCGEEVEKVKVFNTKKIDFEI